VRVETTKLQRELTSLLSHVAEGHTIELTRYGKVVALLAPPDAINVVSESPRWETRPSGQSALRNRIVKHDNTQVLQEGQPSDGSNAGAGGE
jgi:antitoxin (DNA-binding transcriptional repressor) of toxin-antitoxin stability system